jgi:hypothetical protein
LQLGGFGLEERMLQWVQEIQSHHILQLPLASLSSGATHLPGTASVGDICQTMAFVTVTLFSSFCSLEGFMFNYPCCSFFPIFFPQKAQLQYQTEAPSKPVCSGTHINQYNTDV